MNQALDTVTPLNSGVASSSFRRLFYEQGGAGIPLKKESKHLENFKRLHQYPAAQRQYMIRNFFKVRFDLVEQIFNKLHAADGSAGSVHTIDINISGAI